MIYKYKKIIDKYTTIDLIKPDEELHADNIGIEPIKINKKEKLSLTKKIPERISEIGELDGYTYVNIPDIKKLPPQHEKIKLEPVEDISAILEDLKKTSPHIKLINKRVVDKIREKYSVNDELKCLRLGVDSMEFQEYNKYVEKCVAWGKGEKEKLGLISDLNY